MSGLGDSLGRFRRADPGSGETDAVTRRGLDDLVRQVERLELRLNLVIVALVGAVLADLYRVVSGH